MLVLVPRLRGAARRRHAQGRPCRRRAEPLGVAMLKDSTQGTQFSILRGRAFKRAHASGLQKAVTKGWSPRFVLFDGARGDLFYWKEQPTAEWVEKKRGEECVGATRVNLARARLAEATEGPAPRPVALAPAP